MKRGLIAVFLVVLFLCPIVCHAATDDSAAVVPFLDQTTIAVARIDVRAINIDAIGLWLENSLKTAGQSPDSIADVEAWLKSDDCKNLKKAQADLLAAGGKTIFMVVDFDGEPMPFFVIPMAAGSKVDELKSAATELLKLQDGDPKSTEMVEVNKSLRVAPVQIAGKLANIKGTPRADIISILNGSDAALRIAVATTDSARQKLIALAPNLPPEMGGGPMTVLTDGLRSATLSVTAPPMVAVRIGIGVSNADSLKSVISVARDALAKAAPSQSANLQNPNNMLNQLELKAVNGRGVLVFDTANCSRLVASLYQPYKELLAAREKADIIYDQANLKEIYQLSQIYAAEHNGKSPGSLEEIARVVQPNSPDPMSLGAFKNIRDPSRKPAYIYNDPHGSLNKIPHPKTWVLIYDAYDKWPVIHGVSGINVGFADGHVEFITDEAKFKALLAGSTPLAQ